MVIETEVKFRLKCSFSDILNKLSNLNPIYIEDYYETDTYFNHPCRDFRESDEALRLRTKCSSVGKTYFVTYKSRRILDKFFKKRIEYEVVVDDLDTFKKILSNLGFSETVSFTKKRIVYRINNSYLYLDDLFGIGLFIEIEGFEEDIVKAIDLIKDCIEKIDKTYLEICLETSKCEVNNICI